MRYAGKTKNAQSKPLTPMEQENEQYSILKQKAGAYCSLAEHCESEVREKLIAWGADNEECISRIIDYLYENNFISPARYCRAYTHDKLIYQGWGKRKIEAMLLQKQLPQQNIREALNAVDNEQYEDILLSLLQKKARSLKGETGNMLQTKLLRFAASRGFDYASTIVCIRKLGIQSNV